MPKVLAGQVQLTSSAQQLDPNQTTSAAIAFTIRAPITNSYAVFVGGDNTVTDSTAHQLDPGDAVTYKREIQNGQPAFQNRLSDFWVAGTSGTTGDVITWLALA
jgi:hypothetical protein